MLGKNPDADGVVIANWYCVNGMLVVNFTDAANDRAIAKCLRESDFSDLTFDKVYLTGAAAPAFFADKQVADKPTDAEITYSASWILLKDSDGFSQTVTMLDEMCIRDRFCTTCSYGMSAAMRWCCTKKSTTNRTIKEENTMICLLYTSPLQWQQLKAIP